MTDTKSPLSDFLGLTSLKEVSLLIAKDGKEMKLFREELEKNGFKEAMKPEDLIEQAKVPSKTFMDLDARFEKGVYDFLAQYPTGQIQLFDGKAMASTFAAPVYKDSTFVFLVSKERLSMLEKEGFALRRSAGPSYQS